MSRTKLSRNVAGIAFVTLVAAGTLMSAPSHASITLKLMNCADRSRAGVVSCCETVTRGTLPFWMRDTGRNCSTAVECREGDKKCHIVVYVPPRHTDDQPIPVAKELRSARGANGPAGKP